MAESGWARSSSDCCSASTPRKISTTPPMTITPAPNEVADKQPEVVLPVADELAIEPRTKRAEALHGSKSGDSST